MKFTDSHCHLDFKEFSLNTEQLLSQCYLSGIHQLIIPAISPTNWQQVLTLSNHKKRHSQKTATQPTLYPALGIHPWFLNELEEQVLDELEQLINTHQQGIVAIGETGIDGVIAKEQNNINKQIDFFEVQLALAKQYQLPIIVHHRRSHQDIVPLLKKAQLTNGGVIHAFSGSYQQAKAYLDLGFKLGVGGTITYPRAQKTMKAIKRLPVSSLLLETDAPSMPLFGFQGQTNSPLALIKIFNVLNELLDGDEEDLANQLEQNVNELFKLTLG